MIHGYPMRYNAGSEVYTQNLSLALATRHEVHVFTRQENSFLPEYSFQREADPLEPSITLHIVNMARARDGHRHQQVDDAFTRILEEVEPDVVHVGHLNHLSTSLVFAARDRGVPVVFTLHDYWLMCPRGQFIQMYPEDQTDHWAVCDGQDDRLIARALESGASDYIVKPFSSMELVARVRAALRRRTGVYGAEPAKPYVLDDLTIDYALRVVKVAGSPVQLTSTEYDLLYELSIHAPRVVRHNHLLQRVWGPPRPTDLKALRTHLMRLRRKLGEVGTNPKYIFAEPRVGYRMPKGEADRE